MQTFRKRRAGFSATAGLSCYVLALLTRTTKLQPDMQIFVLLMHQIRLAVGLCSDHGGLTVLLDPLAGFSVKGGKITGKEGGKKGQRSQYIRPSL